MNSNRFIAALLIILLTGCNHSAKRITVSGDANPQIVIFPESADRDHITLEVSHRGAMIPVSINGQAPLPFLFDSGSTSNGISVKVAEQLGLRRLDPKMKTRIGQTESDVHLYYAKSLQIGQTTFHHVSFQAHDPKLETRAKPTQLIGYLLFQETPFTLDLANKRLSLFKTSPAHIHRWSPLQSNEFQLPQVTTRFLHPTTGATIVEFPALVDTGAKSAKSPTITMPRSIPPSDPRIRPFLEGDGSPLTTVTAITKNENTWYPADIKVDFGPAEGEGTFVLIFEDEGKGSFAFEKRGILELSLFLEGSLTFDIPHKRWAVAFPD